MDETRKDPQFQLIFSLYSYVMVIRPLNVKLYQMDSFKYPPRNPQNIP